MPKVDQFSRAELLLSTVRLTLAQHGESNGSATWRCQCGTECDNRIGLRAHVAGKLWEHWTATSALDALTAERQLSDVLAEALRAHYEWAPSALRPAADIAALAAYDAARGAK